MSRLCNVISWWKCFEAQSLCEGRRFKTEMEGNAWLGGVRDDPVADDVKVDEDRQD